MKCKNTSSTTENNTFQDKLIIAMNFIYFFYTDLNITINNRTNEKNGGISNFLIFSGQS